MTKDAQISGDPPAPTDWHYYRGPKKGTLPASPPWRSHPDVAAKDYDVEEAEPDDTFQPGPGEIAMVNAALYLRRPLLITGDPGSGKSSIARSIAYELKLGKVLLWPINSRSTLQQGLYDYDALARLQDASRRQAEGDNAKDVEIGEYLKLGPLGTALLPRAKPRVLLVDEIDKSDIDLPNDLLHVFERGEFEIPELTRAAAEGQTLSVKPHDSQALLTLDSGTVRCREFPLVILTSNGERDFPPAFNRRCLRLEMSRPDKDRLTLIVKAHLERVSSSSTSGTGMPADWSKAVEGLVKRFIELRDKPGEMMATDQLLNALHFVRQGVDVTKDKKVLDAVLRGLATKSGGK